MSRDARESGARRVAALLLALMISGCGGAVAEHNGAGPRAPRQSDADATPDHEGNQQQTPEVAASTPEPPTGTRWEECVLERPSAMALMVPVPAGAALRAERDSCMVMPLSARDPGDAQWFYGVMASPASGGDEALLASGSDAARRFIVEGAELSGVVDMGQAPMLLLGAPTTVFRMSGVSHEFAGQTREISGAVVHRAGTYVFGAVVTAPGVPQHDELRGFLEHIRAR